MKTAYLIVVSAFLLAVLAIVATSPALRARYEMKMNDNRLIILDRKTGTVFYHGAGSLSELRIDGTVIVRKKTLTKSGFAPTSCEKDDPSFQ